METKVSAYLILQYKTANLRLVKVTSPSGWQACKEMVFALKSEEAL